MRIASKIILEVEVEYDVNIEKRIDEDALKIRISVPRGDIATQLLDEIEKHPNVTSAGYTGDIEFKIIN